MFKSISCDLASSFVLSSTSDGTLGLWTDFPHLTLLREFNCFRKEDMDEATPMDTDGPVENGDDDDDPLAHGTLNSVHIVTDGAPMSNVFSVAVISQGEEGSSLRVHVLQPNWELVAEPITEGGNTFLRYHLRSANRLLCSCTLCSANGEGPVYFPDRAAMSVHLKCFHRQAMLFPSNLVYSVKWLGDFTIPLASVSAARLMRENKCGSYTYCGSKPTALIVTGISADGALSLATCPLAPFVSQSTAQAVNYPCLQWTVKALVGLPAVELKPKLVPMAWNTIDDCFAGVAGDGSFVFMSCLKGSLLLKVDAPPGDHFVDFAVTREFRKIGAVTEGGRFCLVRMDHFMPVPRPPDLTNLTADILNATKVCDHLRVLIVIVLEHAQVMAGIGGIADCVCARPHRHDASLCG